MPEKLQDLLSLCTSLNPNFVTRSEDSALLDGKPNPRYDRAKDTYMSSLTTDYKTLLIKFQQLVENYGSRENKQILKKRREEISKYIEKGIIIPVFGSEDKPCIIRKKLKGKDVYNAIPNALQHTKNDYLIKNKQNNEVVWFGSYTN